MDNLREHKINIMELLKEYIETCKFLNLDPTKKKSKDKFLEYYMKSYHMGHGLTGFEETQKEVRDILKYNSLKIKKLYEEDIEKSKKQFDKMVKDWKVV